MSKRKWVNGFEERINDWSGTVGFDPATLEERKAWREGKMTDEEFHALCDKRRKEHYKSEK